MMYRACLGVMALVVAQGIGHAAPKVRVTFRPLVEVTGTNLRLGELAEVQGGDSALVRAIRLLDVGMAPPPGQKRFFSPFAARPKLRALGLRDEEAVLEGSMAVSVTRAFQRVSSEVLLRKAREAVEVAAPGSTLTLQGTVQTMVLPVGALTLRAQTPSLFARSAQVKVEALLEGKVAGSVTVSLAMRRKCAALVTTRPLSPGAVLTEQDVILTEVLETPGAPAPIAELKAVLGRRLSVALPEGATLAVSQLKLVNLVRRGDRVRVVCRAGGVTLVMTAEAMAEGGLGQNIRVKNPSSGLDFTAVVVGEGEVETQ